MVNSQFHFSLGNKISYLQDDFFVSESNQLAYKQITSYPNWGQSRLAKICLITGPKFSGKTHLAHIFAGLANAKFITSKDLEQQLSFKIIKSYKALIIDDIEQKLEHESIIFNIFNECLDTDKYLLILSAMRGPSLEFRTKDLQSRIDAVTHIAIAPPTIEQVEAMLIKNFSDRQVSISLEVVKFLVNRIERSYKAIDDIIDRLDKLSLEHKRKITINLVKEVFEWL